MTLTVRRAVRADSAALAALRWTWRVDEAGEQPVGTRKEFLELMREWCAVHPDHVVVLAEEAEAGSVVGMAWLALGDRVPSPGGVRRRSVWLQSVYVRPDLRGGGIGSGLLARVAEIARTEDCAYVAVHPSLRSAALYERCGYALSEGLRELRLDH